MLENTDLELTGIDAPTAYYAVKQDRRTGLGRIRSDMLANTDVEFTKIDKPTDYFLEFDRRPKFVEYIRVFDELFESKALLVNNQG